MNEDKSKYMYMNLQPRSYITSDSFEMRPWSFLYRKAMSMIERAMDNGVPHGGAKESP